MIRSTRVRYAISADLVDSRRIASRQAFPSQLNAALGEINDSRSLRLHAPLVATRGIDEISGVLQSPREIAEVITSLNIRIWPNRFRFGLGIGTIDVEDTSRDARKMDGPAFHRASQALAAAKHDGVPLRIETGHPPTPQQRLVESTLWAFHALIESWTPPTHARVARRREFQGTDAELAAILGISKQAISASLQRGHFKLLGVLQTDLTNFLNAVHWSNDS